jgi:hypothetical protein
MREAGIEDDERIIVILYAFFFATMSFIVLWALVTRRRAVPRGLSEQGPERNTRHARTTGRRPSQSQREGAEGSPKPEAVNFEFACWYYARSRPVHVATLAYVCLVWTVVSRRYDFSNSYHVFSTYEQRSVMTSDDL